MGITSSRIINDDDGWPMRRVIYGYTTQDGVEHVVGPVFLDTDVPNPITPAVDMAARETGIWDSLVKADIAQAVNVVKSNGLVALQAAGGDPTQITASYATAAEIYPALFEWWQNAPTMEAQALVPAIDSITDTTLTALIPGITATQVAGIRTRANTLRPINAAIVADGGI